MIKKFFTIFNVLGNDNKLKAFKLLLILLSILVLELLNLSLIIPMLTVILSENVNLNLPFFSIFENFFNIDFNNILTIGSLFLIIIIIKIIFLLLFEYKTHSYSREILIDVYLKAYSYFLYSPWQEISKKDHAYIMRNILSDTGTFVMEGVLKCISIIKNTFFLLFITVYLFTINFKITLSLLILLIVFTFFFIVVLKKRLLELSFKTAAFDKLRLKYISESILNLREIKLNRNYQYYIDLFRNNENKVTNVVITNEILRVIPRYLLEIIIVATMLVVLVALEFQNYDIVSLIPILGLYGFALLRMIPIFIVYNADIQNIRTAKFQIDEVIKNAARYKKVYEENLKIKTEIDIQKLNFTDDISLKISNLYFSYPNRNILFEDVNLELKTNNTIYLEGSNGSGKSTFVDLLAGLLKPEKGKIEINGYKLDEILNEWLKNVGYVSQTNFLTNDTIKDNILFGRDNISEKRVLEVLKIVELDEVIKNLPDGINTKIGSLGNFFSGGQKQRLSVARALVKNPKVIILDEATNAFDIEGEKKFLEIVNKIKKGKIIIFIAHSSSIKNFCDIKFIIKNKKIENYEA